MPCPSLPCFYTPAETVTWNFAVKNFDGQRITETNLHYDLAFDVVATQGKAAIASLVVTVKDSADTDYEIFVDNRLVLDFIRDRFPSAAWESEPGKATSRALIS